MSALRLAAVVVVARAGMGGIMEGDRPLPAAAARHVPDRALLGLLPHLHPRAHGEGEPLKVSDEKAMGAQRPGASEATGR